MGWNGISPEFQQALRQFKIFLCRFTPNKRAEALNLGVSDAALGRWCDVSRIQDNMPAALLARHSAAYELLASLAQENGWSVVKRVPLCPLNGDIDDERNNLMVALGQWTEKYQKAMSDRLSPDRISVYEAMNMKPLVEKIETLAATARAELEAIISGDEL